MPCGLRPASSRGSPFHSLELMSLGAYFATITPLRKLAFLACAIWFLFYLYLGGAVGIARLMSSRTNLEVVLIHAVNAIFSSLAIVEVIRSFSKRTLRWNDKNHFSVVGAVWLVLVALTGGIVLLMRSAGALS